MEYLHSERQQYKNIYKELITLPTRQSIERQTEIVELIRIIDNAINYYKEGK